jgi:predicted peroxiredoxin
MALDTETKHQRILYVASHGMEDSYRATLIFAAAKAVRTAEERPEVKVALLGEATWLANPDIQNNFSLGPPRDLAGNEVRKQLSSLIAECGELGVAIGV